MSRSVKKGPFIEKSLYKKIMEMSKVAGDRKMLKTFSRTSTIIPEMVGMTISVYNGKTWIPVYVTENLVGQSSASSRRRAYSAVTPAATRKPRRHRGGKWLKPRADTAPRPSGSWRRPPRYDPWPTS